MTSKRKNSHQKSIIYIQQQQSTIIVTINNYIHHQQYISICHNQHKHIFLLPQRGIWPHIKHMYNYTTFNIHIISTMNIFISYLPMNPEHQAHVETGQTPP